MPVYTEHKPIRHFTTNTAGTDYVVGDIHGCIDYLNRAMELLKFDKACDRMFSVGDLIDRGPYSMETGELIMEPWFFAVRANHEDMMIKSVVDNDWRATDMWLNNGGDWSRQCDQARVRALAEAAATLPYVIAVGDSGIDRFNIVHAELAFDDGIKRIVVSDQWLDNGVFTAGQLFTMIWGREMISCGEEHYPPHPSKLFHHPEHLSPTYVGHTPVQRPVRVQNQIYIDSGAVFARRATWSHDRALTIAQPNAGVLHRYIPATDVLYTDYLQDIPQHS